MVNGFKKCTILVASGSQNYLFYSEEQKAKLYEELSMEEESLSKSCVFIGYGNMQNVGGEWKGNHGLEYHFYLVPRGLDLKNTVALVYGDPMPPIMQNKRECLLGDVYPCICLMRRRVLVITCPGIRLVWRGRERRTETVLWMYSPAT